MSPTKQQTPAPGAAFFFEGYEYEYEGSEAEGTLTFRRPEGGDARYRRVTIDARELGRSTGAALQDALDKEHADWVRRTPPQPPKAANAAQQRQAAASARLRAEFLDRLPKHYRGAGDALRKAATRQFYHIVADLDDDQGERPLRLIAPPVEIAGVPVKLARQMRETGKLDDGNNGGGVATAVRPHAPTITQTPPRGK